MQVHRGASDPKARYQDLRGVVGVIEQRPGGVLFGRRVRRTHD